MCVLNIGVENDVKKIKRLRILDWKDKAKEEMDRVHDWNKLYDVAAKYNRELDSSDISKVVKGQGIRVYWMIPAQFYTGIVAQKLSNNHIYVIFSDITYHEIMLSDVLWHTHSLDDSDSQKKVENYLMRTEYRKFVEGKSSIDFQPYPFEFGDDGKFRYIVTEEESADVEDSKQEAVAYDFKSGDDHEESLGRNESAPSEPTITNTSNQTPPDSKQEAVAYDSKTPDDHEECLSRNESPSQLTITNTSNQTPPKSIESVMSTPSSLLRLTGILSGVRVDDDCTIQDALRIIEEREVSLVSHFVFLCLILFYYIFHSI